MTQDIDDAVDQVLSGGLADASEADILRQLDAELQQQTQARAMVLGADEPDAWVLGGNDASGFGSMAHRFINYYSTALRREICGPKDGLKQEYHDALSGQQLREQIKTLVPTILTAIGVGASLVNPAAIAAVVAVWLLKVGLEQWCAAPPAPADATAQAASAAPGSVNTSAAQPSVGSGAEPMPVDPSVSTGSADGLSTSDDSKS